MDDAYKQVLIKQGYRFTGEHSAVKVCEWTKKSLVEKGTCYKHKFYGIKSHRCVQLSAAVNFCNLDCMFCWRERNNSGFGTVDNPSDMIDQAIRHQKKLLDGFGGQSRTNWQKYLESKEPAHFAISLNGENLAYPHISELIEELARRGHSSFVVTNGMFPHVMEKMHPPTQLYISLSAPNEKLFNEIDRPMLANGWQRLMNTMELLPGMRKKTRTVIRLTLINGINTPYLHQFAEIIRKARPMFIEVKSYMHVGASTRRLGRENMLSYEAIVEHARNLGQMLGYEIAEHAPESLVCLMMEKDTTATRFIDFSEIAGRAVVRPSPEYIEQARKAFQEQVEQAEPVSQEAPAELIQIQGLKA